MPTPSNPPREILETPLPIVRIDAGPPSVSPSNHLDGARYAPFDTLRRPAHLEYLTFQTSRFARNLENRGIIFPLSRRRTRRSRCPP